MGSSGKLCRIPNCGRPVKSREMCHAHYRRWRKGQDLYEPVREFKRKVGFCSIRDGQRDDNRLSNLELWSSSHPYGQRVSNKIAWAEELLNQYAPQKLPEPMLSQAPEDYCG